jgi:methionyl-tRNA synthetase
MPETVEKIAAQINTAELSYESINSFGGYKSGSKVGEATPLFARIDEQAKLEEIKADLEKDDDFEPIKDEISIEDFDKLDLRVAKVISCEEVKKSEKLLKFELDLSGEKRVILSGIKKWYKPDEMVGKNLIIIANLKPRKMMGIESKGMILSAVDSQDNLTALTTIADIKPGSIVG